jgi:predicted PurR-regulated permease PerM
MICFLVVVVLAVGLLAPGAVFAVDPAPRISDREIIEGLADLNAKYTELKAELRRVEGELKAEFRTVRVEIDSVRNEMRQMDKRLEQVWALLMIVIAGIMGLIGFIIWDRKTAMRPIEQEVQLLRQDLDA